MRVYAETNFILELALEQEQHESCAELLHLAESGQLELAIPAYSFVEPYEALARDHKTRERIRRDLRPELDQLMRSAGHQRRVEEIRGVVDLLVDSAQDEAKRLEDIRVRILSCCQVLPLDLDCLGDAAAYRAGYGLSAQDSVVYAAVHSHLERSAAVESCFLTRDADFKDPDLIEDLRRHRCTLIPRFDHGLERVRSWFRRADPEQASEQD